MIINQKVTFFKWRNVQKNGKSYNEKVLEGKGRLLAFGVNCEELTHGVGTFSTGIIVLEDGSLVNVPVELITLDK